MKTILFDVGGVLVDYQREPLLSALANGCQTASTDAVAGLIGELDLSSGLNTVADLHTQLCQQFGFRDSYETLCGHWTASLTRREWVEPLLQSLHGRARLAVLSDTNAVHWSYIETRLLDPRHFEHVFVSHILRQKKNTPAVFGHVLKVMGATAQSCLFIDDSVTNLEQARSAEMRTHHFQDPRQLMASIESHLNAAED